MSTVETGLWTEKELPQLSPESKAYIPEFVKTIDTCSAQNQVWSVTRYLVFTMNLQEKSYILLG